MKALPTICLAAALLWLAPARAEEPAAPKPVAAKKFAKKFDHVQHQAAAKLVEKPEPCNNNIPRRWKGPAVTADNCESCHPTDKVGVITPPGKRGHQPCMSAGCHVTEFLRVGETTRRERPECYEKAAAFCKGCHTDTPENFQKAPAAQVFKNHPAPNFHVELPHFDHLDNEIKGHGKVGCRDCHVVDPTTNALKLETPGHAECARCHGVTAAPMKTCDHCHKMPGKTVYLDKARPQNEVRSCGSPRHLREAKRRRKPVDQVPCFKHETKEHRFAEDGKALQCNACHYMFENRKLWGKYKYDNLKNIAAAPVMDNRRDRAHKTCGDSSACHKRDVNGSRGRCRLCHSQQLIYDEFTD